MAQTSHSPLRLPDFLRKHKGNTKKVGGTKRVLREGRLHSVCEEARCPNIEECFSQKTATFMILGDICTRRCHFCAVKTGRPKAVDTQEPMNLVKAVQKMGLEYVVLTSVDRDELEDKGAGHFVACIEAIKEFCPGVEVEILTPDFQGRADLIDQVLAAGPDVFNHNIETVARLYKKVRPQSDLKRTQFLIEHVAKAKTSVVKSGMMLGLGESESEVFETMSTLKEFGVDIVTIGQYMRPSLKQWPVERYYREEEYQQFIDYGLKIGLSHVFAGPFVRSSYHAKEAHLAHLKYARKNSVTTLHVLSA